jgi:hypothetical protein
MGKCGCPSAGGLLVLLAFLGWARAGGAIVLLPWVVGRARQRLKGARGVMVRSGSISRCWGWATLHRDR